MRPTQAKVRQALFNILGEAILDARVLDGFAGSGAIGLEALSRDAAFVAFVESDTEAVLSIRDHLARLDTELLRSAWRVVHFDIERGLRQLAKDEAPFDVIVFDPPYRSDEGKKALNVVVQCAMLRPSGVVVVEHERRTLVPTFVDSLRQWKQHRYGDTVLSFYQMGPARA
jgi:16S rRNA (guanine(966)-N(2))-methyltransferase RsmD